MTQTIYIITGPTAVGKTEYALSFAEKNDAEIISCDASLFYRGMDIGTAKPSRKELARVRHHLIDICDVSQPYDITAYVRDAHRAVEDVSSRGKAILVTGGSGFYLKSFLAPVLDTIEVSDALRARVASIYEKGQLDGLLEELYRLNPGGLENLDEKNPRRVMRALERCLASGKTLSELQKEFAQRPKPYPDFSKKIILLEREKEELKERIKLRVECMIRDGLIDEVRRLKEQGIEDNPSAASAIGYRETLEFLNGRLDQSDLMPLIVQNTVKLAKKQRTWFRTQIPEPDRRIQF